MERIDSHRDYIIKEHRAKRTVNDIAREFGVTSKVIVRVLGRHYRAIGRPSIFPRLKAVRLYQSGMSEKQVADKFNVSRSVIRRELLMRGVHVRSASEAEFLKWSQMTGEQRSKQVRAANEAVRGRKKPLEEKIKAAQTRQTIPHVHSSSYEHRLQKMLTDRGLVCTPQYAVGPYNCDLMVDAVAVEVWAGGWHFYGKHKRILNERFHYILNRGYPILVVFTDSRFPLTERVADYVTSYIKGLRRNPPMICEYRVIWGANEYSVSGSAKDKHISVIAPFTGRRNPANGRYERISR